MSNTSNSSRTALILGLTFAMVFPTVMAGLYFLALGGTGKLNPAQQFSYTMGKVIQFAFPLLFLYAFRQHRPATTKLTSHGLALGIGFGVLVGLIFFAGYSTFLRDTPLVAGVGTRVRLKIQEFGIVTAMDFVWMAILLSTLHSLLEEYYWRWFVFGQLRSLMSLQWSIPLSSLAFMSHHVLILWAFAPNKVFTVVIPASVGVAIGGAVWAWLYDRTNALWSPWLSHILIDGAIMAIGWDMMQRG